MPDAGTSRPELVAVFGPTGVGKTAIAVALSEMMRARGEDPVAVSADALQVYAGLEILTGVAAPARETRTPPDLVPTTRRHLQRRPVRRARTRRDRRSASLGAAPDRRRRNRPVSARGACRTRSAPAAGGGRPRALDGRAAEAGSAGPACPARAPRCLGGRGDRPTRPPTRCARTGAAGCR